LLSTSTYIIIFEKKILFSWKNYKVFSPFDHPVKLFNSAESFNYFNPFLLYDMIYTMSYKLMHNYFPWFFWISIVMLWCILILCRQCAINTTGIMQK
jgi:hypothetical protein